MLIITKSSNYQKGVIFALISAVLWGVSGPCSEFLFTHKHVNMEWLVTIRLLISGVVLLTIGFITKGKHIWLVWTARVDAVQILLFSVAGVFTVQYTYFAAIKNSNAATATVLDYLAPVMITVYMALKKQRLPTYLEFSAILLAITGTFLLVTHGQSDSLSISVMGLVWGLSAALSHAFYAIQPVSLLSRHDPVIVIGWGMLVGGLTASFFHSPFDISGQWDIETYLSTIYVILFGSVAAFSLYLIAVKYVGGALVSLLTSAELLSAALVSIIWLDVSFSYMDWLGCLLILSTILLLTIRRSGAGLISSSERA